VNGIADVKGGKCPCGGAFSKRVPYPDDKLLKLPICESCDSRPALYVIDVDAKDENGNPLKFRIRNTKDSERLDSPTKVAYIISVIQREMMEGSFNVRHYDSSKSKEAFIFKNYAVEYLAHHERRLLRKEISPKGLKDKEGLIRRELLPFFGNMEIFRIKDAVIRKFKDSYVAKLRTRDLALGELKSLLNQAQRDGMISVAPKFEPIPRAKVRDEIISLELAQKTVELISGEVHRDMYSLLLIYPLRPGELRALMWKNIDLNKGVFVIDQHFSNEILIPGRKSVGRDKKQGSIEFPINAMAREIFMRQRSQKITSLNSFVFLSKTGKPVSETTLWGAWDCARKKLGHKFAPYECRHVSASELYKKVNGDLIRMKEVGGWTNTSTLERYVTDRSDNSNLF
jgi:integrase